MRKETTVIDSKKISISICDREDAPVVFSTDFVDESDAVLAECERLGGRAFHLVSISNLRWDEELSPWKSEPVVSKEDRFTGEADAYLKVLEGEIIPYVQQVIPESKCYLLTGYSMGGLFALYAAYKSTSFSGFSAPSGSVWYPDFLKYAEENSFVKKPGAIYLSLGDRESRTRNAYLSRTEDIMRQLEKIFASKEIPVIFELNKGNHFQNTGKRVAKAILWTLQALEAERDPDGEVNKP